MGLEGPYSHALGLRANLLVQQFVSPDDINTAEGEEVVSSVKAPVAVDARQDCQDNCKQAQQDAQGDAPLGRHPRYGRLPVIGFL